MIMLLLFLFLCFFCLFVLFFLGLFCFCCCFLEDDTPTLLLFLALVTGRSLVNLTDELEEDLVDIDAVFRGCLQKGATELVTQVLALVCGHLPLVLQVALVADDDEGHAVTVLYSADLVSQIRNIIECRVGCNRIDQHKPLSASHVLITHRSQFLLTSGVQYLKHTGLTVDFYLLSV